MDVRPFPLHQRGISMLEVLVAALVLSFGITSIGMMMLATLQNSRSTVLHARAVALAQDMAERIRNNAEARTAYDTSATTPTDHNCFQRNGGNASHCTPQQLAAHDLWHWMQLAGSPSSGLPSPELAVSVDESVTPPLHLIRIQWTNGASDESDAPGDQYQLAVRL